MSLDILRGSLALGVPALLRVGLMVTPLLLRRPGLRCLVPVRVTGPRSGLPHRLEILTAPVVVGNPGHQCELLRNTGRDRAAALLLTGSQWLPRE